MGGQMQQASTAATALYDHHGGQLHNTGSAGDTGDAVMARWLQSAGLQHLASPLSSSGTDYRLSPNRLMQGYGTQSAEEKERLSKLMRNLNFNVESGSAPYAPGDALPTDGLFSPELRGDFGAGLLDLHAMDDTELLSEHVIPDSFEASPFMPGGTRAFNNDFNNFMDEQQSEHVNTGNSVGFTVERGDTYARENNVAKIKVVVRKRPLNKKELARREDDIVTVSDNAYVTVHEPKLKVDLTAYVEKHEFCFDAVFDDHVTNDEVYRVTVEPIIPTIFQRTKATCFAYGQTGSGKTFTMQPLPLRASDDLVKLLHHPIYRNERFKLWLSYFEIYGGKLFDLLSDRKKLCMREDGRQQVCIVGLQEFEVSDVQIVKEYIERGNAARSTGSTGANEESSRSHAILQLAVKKHNEIKESKRSNDVTEARIGKVVGKISFIDLAGSERGADTTDNDRQTRIEGAEINKSLLALKECIRALDNDQIHIPFRGSKLTEVLRDSFVGNSRTVMISCISPNAGSCEHTLNTLRYADRVKSLSKTGNSKKDQGIINPAPVTAKESYTSNNEIEYISSYEWPEDEMVSSFVEKAENTGSQPDREILRVEKREQVGNSMRNDVGRSYIPKQVNPGMQRSSSFGFTQHDAKPSFVDSHIQAILEEEEALVAAHRREIEDTMDIVREEMKLLAEVEQPGSLIDDYIGQLSVVLSRKAAGLVGLQARLTRFQQRLKEQEILTRKRVPR